MTMRGIKSAAQAAGQRTALFVQGVKEERKQREKAWRQAELKWQQALSKDLDAAIGKLTYNDAFTKYGPPQVTILRNSEVVAIYQNGRVKSRWFPISNQAVLSCFPHGSRLELDFSATTRLVSWKYTEW